MDDAMEVDVPSSRGAKRTAEDAGLLDKAPKRIKVMLLVRAICIT